MLDCELKNGNYGKEFVNRIYSFIYLCCQSSSVNDVVILVAASVGESDDSYHDDYLTATATSPTTPKSTRISSYFAAPMDRQRGLHCTADRDKSCVLGNVTNRVEVTLVSSGQ